MTAAEIAETLINGNITAAREAILTCGQQYRSYTLADIDIAVTVVDVLEELTGWHDDFTPQLLRLRRCLTGGT